MKRVLSSGLALSAVLSLVGCGGGGSSSPAAAAVETGTAYYLDSAVSGINYKCGSHEGITDQDGKFTFEKGQSCTFYLGDIKLREMDKALLGDGKKIVEEDTKVAVLLQSLDADGNPDNGITIKKEVVEAMADALSCSISPETVNKPYSAQSLPIWNRSILKEMLFQILTPTTL